MIEITEFLVEDVYELKSLNGGIKKKFTSLATNATLFRWQFGDTKQNPIIETTENPYYHTFKEQGDYYVSHQSCAPCGLNLICSQGWCTKLITVVKPKEAAIPPILAIGLATGFLFGIAKKRCEDYDKQKDCKPSDCSWLHEYNKCVRKCTKGFKLERSKTKPLKFECVPIS